MTPDSENRHRSSIEDLLSKIQTLYLREKQANQRKYANGELYNIFSTLGLSTNEVRLHSALIAELLDPNAAHGLGTKPLELFLSVIGLDHWDFDIQSASVEVEHYIGKISAKGDTGGQIDILIVDHKNKALIIENKIYAPDQPNQLLRYQNYARLYHHDNSGHKDNYQLLYLTLYGDCPSENSTCNQVDYMCLSYEEHITKWLNLCLDISTDKPLVNAIIKQYLTTLDTIMDRHSQNYSDKLISLLQEDENIDSVLEIIEHGDRICTKIRQDFMHSLEEMAREEGFKMGYSQGIVNQYERDQWIWFELPISDKWSFCIGQYNPGKLIAYGIGIDESKHKDMYKYQYNQLEHIWKDFEKDGKFPMGRNFLWSETGKRNSGTWFDWRNAGTPRDMRNGKLLGFIRRELQRVKEMQLIEKIIELENKNS